MVTSERILVVQEKINETARLGQRMDVIAANTRRLSHAGLDLKLPPNVAAELAEFEQHVVALERLFNISG